MPDVVVLAVVMMAAVVSLALVVVLGAAAYLLLTMARERRTEIESSRPLPFVEQPEQEDLTEEERSAMLFGAIETARDQNLMAKDDWWAEKRAEGWTDERIQEFLDSRPPLELN